MRARQPPTPSGGGPLGRNSWPKSKHSTVLVFTFFGVGGIDLIDWSDHSEAMASEDRGVERTNDDATESKCSAISLGYYDDK